MERMRVVFEDNGGVQSMQTTKRMRQLNLTADSLGIREAPGVAIPHNKKTQNKHGLLRLPPMLRQKNETQGRAHADAPTICFKPKVLHRTMAHPTGFRSLFPGRLPLTPDVIMKFRRWLRVDRR